MFVLHLVLCDAMYNGITSERILRAKVVITMRGGRISKEENF